MIYDIEFQTKKEQINMVKKVSVLLVGISGYGEIYLNNLLQNEHVKLSGVVDINPAKSIYYKSIKGNNIPIFKSIIDFYEEHTCDLAIIATPIQLHAEQASYALKNDSNVLCEKPLSANIKDIQNLTHIKNTQKKLLAVGFNWSFTNYINQLKKEILAKKFGEIKRLKSMVLWPRSKDYYNRSNWAGKMYNKNGDFILDSVANNATAHFLHNLFYLTGDSIETSAKLKSVTPELYRANSIETFDTCAIRISTYNDIIMYFYASHAVEEEVNPKFEIECEYAVIKYDANKHDSSILVEHKNGEVEYYQDPESNHLAKLDVCLSAIQNDEQDILCGPEAVSAHMLCIHAMHESIEKIPAFPPEMIKFNKDENLIWVDGLANTLLDCYQEWTLPSEGNISWSYKGDTTKVNIK